MIIQIEHIFWQEVNIMIKLLHNKFGPNPSHESWENQNMDVDDDGSFLETMKHFDLKLSGIIHIIPMHIL